MARKYKTLLIIINLIFVFTIISIPTSILLAEYSSSNKIDKTLTFTHSLTIPPLKRELNLNADLGRIEINYATQPVDYLVRVDVAIEMAGPNLAGKSYLDFFNIVWQNTSGLVNFTMELKAGMDQVELLTLLKDINIIVTLRRDVIFDININSKIQVDVKISVPWKTSVGNILTNISSGDIQYDFYYCIIGGNITGILNNGKIMFKSFNAEYTQNSVWTLSSNTNNIHITQYESMGANITGTISTTEDVGTRLIYNDLTPEVGAKFTLYNYRYPQIRNGTYENFDFYEVPEGINRYCYISNDFPANYSYNLELFLGGILNYNLFSA